MSAEIAYHFFYKLKKDHFSLIYLGEFSDEITEVLMRVNEDSIHEAQSFKKKLSFLIAECFQNIIRHADKPDIVNRTNNKPNMFLLRSIGNASYIGSTNLISNVKKEGLLLKLKSINTLSKEKLKEVYIDALVKNEISDKGGAGLGLIEMARKSDCQLEYDFEFVNYFFSVFFMQLRVMAPKALKEENVNNTSISTSIELYNAMLAENILMLRKGDFSQKSILPLLEIIKNNLSSGSFHGFKKKILYLLVEMLQNISKHGEEHNGVREGIFIIARYDNRYLISIGNYVSGNKVKPLKEVLDNLISMDQNELAELYKKNLQNKQANSKGSAGIGLIEMCKYSSEKLKYNFATVTADLSFFSLSVIV